MLVPDAVRQDTQACMGALLRGFWVHTLHLSSPLSLPQDRLLASSPLWVCCEADGLCLASVPGNRAVGPHSLAGSAASPAVVWPCALPQAVCWVGVLHRVFSELLSVEKPFQGPPPLRLTTSDLLNMFGNH